MAGLHQQLFVSCILFSVATLTTAVPFDRQQGLSSTLYTKNISSDSENVCMIDDVLYQVGDPIPTASPCEKCVCRPPGFACSIITCEKRPNCRALQRSNQCCPEYKCDCEIDGKVYHNGEKLDNTQNPCKVCYCQGGEIACTVIECYKRDDCVPKLVPGMCCPKYDNCPPRDPARSTSSSFGPPVETTNTTTAREVPKFREVAEDRLNLLGEPEPTNQQLPEKSISNNVYDIPQGDDPQAYEVYDESSTSSTSTTGFFAYEYGLTSPSTPIYDSYDEFTASTTPNSASGSTSTSTSDTTPWTNIPTFPHDELTLGPDWPTITGSSSDVSSEHIPTWGVNYTELTTTTEEILTWTWSTDNFSFLPVEYNASLTVNTYKPDNASTVNASDNFSTEYPSINNTPADYFTEVNSTDDTLSGSGEGELNEQISNCTDDILECGQSVRVNYKKFNEKFSTGMFESYTLPTAFNTDSPLNSSILISNEITSTASTSETEANTHGVTADQEASNENSELSKSETTTDVDSTGIMADMPGKEHEEASTTDTWTERDQSTSLSDTKVMHNVLESKDNRTMASLRAGEGSSNDTTEESSTTEDESSYTATTESSYTATTESSTVPSLPNGDDNETGAPSTDESSGRTADTTSADSTTTSLVTETVAFESSTLETLSTTQTSEISGSQSTETGEGATTTTENNS